jgi:hypothetical protein
MSSAMAGIDEFPDNLGGLSDVSTPGYEQSMFFDADMPWPETPERERPEPWIPESGEYRFVPEELVRQLENPEQLRRHQRPVFQPYPGYPPPPPVRPPYYGYY